MTASGRNVAGLASKRKSAVNEQGAATRRQSGIDALTAIDGVGTTKATNLSEAGINTISKVAKSTVAALEATGLGSQTATRVKQAANEMVTARREERVESSDAILLVHRFVGPTKVLGDGSRDIDFDQLKEQMRERGIEGLKGVYIPCSSLSSIRDTPWKAGKSGEGKSTLYGRISWSDNRLLIRDILTDYSYSDGGYKSIPIYFIPCPDLTNDQIESLESHMASLIVKVNPKVLEYKTMEKKVNQSHRANINFGAAIAGIEHSTIGAGRGRTLRGLTAERRADAEMLARTLGLGGHR